MPEPCEGAAGECRSKRESPLFNRLVFKQFKFIYCGVRLISIENVVSCLGTQNKMTPILSIETILSAMMCLCSGNGNSSLDFYSTISNTGNQQKPNMMMSRDNFKAIETKLNNIEQQLARLQKYSSYAPSPQFRLGLQPQQECPRNIAAAPNTIYSIKVPKYGDAFPALCSGNTDHGIGWMIVQQRLDGSENFLRSWQEYRQGFGLLNGEFFLGLDKLHALTTTQPHELLIVLENFDGDRRFANYDHFIVGSVSDDFALKELGKYSGTAGDALTFHVGSKFSTFDRDQDGALENCAVRYTGAWWYANCHLSNLNGQYLAGELSEEQFGKGVIWKPFAGQYYSLKSVQMMIRPIK